MFRKVFLTALILFTAALVFGGAGTQSSPAPASGGPVPLLWMPSVLNGSTIYPADDCLVAQTLNEKFNVKITVQQADAQQVNTMALMYATGTIPDVNPVFPGNFPGFYEQGLYREIPMNLLRQYAPTLYAYSSNIVDYNSLPVMVNGKLYGIPHTSGELVNLSIIRTDWLEKVGKKKPTTLAEFEDVAEAFKNRDPDGNGINDTYLLSWATGWGSNFNWIRAAYGIQTD